MEELPFFDDGHRRLSQAAAAFAGERIAPLAAGDEQRTDETARQYVRLLAEGGWLDCVGSVDIRAACLTRWRLAQESSLADSMFAMQGLGGLPIAVYGSAPQRQRWLNAICGGAIGAFALTEAEAGSDPAGMSTRAARDGAGYRLTGEKTFISNAGLADVYIVFARTGEVQQGPSFSAFIVEGRAAGLRTERMELIAPHPIGTVRFDGVHVPAEQRLGAEGEGLHVALGTLDRFRCTVGAAACGMGRRALDEAAAYVRRRAQFGRPLAKFQAVQFMLAEMATELEAAELLVARAAWQLDGARSEPSLVHAATAVERACKRAASMAKLYATEAAQRVVDRAVQLLGGRGLVRGQAVERLYREVRALRIYEGTSEIQKLVIARTLAEDAASAEGRGAHETPAAAAEP